MVQAVARVYSTLSRTYVTEFMSKEGGEDDDEGVVVVVGGGAGGREPAELLPFECLGSSSEDESEEDRALRGEALPAARGLVVVPAGADVAWLILSYLSIFLFGFSNTWGADGKEGVGDADFGEKERVGVRKKRPTLLCKLRHCQCDLHR